MSTLPPVTLLGLHTGDLSLLEDRLHRSLVVPVLILDIRIITDLIRTLLVAVILVFRPLTKTCHPLDLSRLGAIQISPKINPTLPTDNLGRPCMEAGLIIITNIGLLSMAPLGVIKSLLSNGTRVPVPVVAHGQIIKAIRDLSLGRISGSP